MPEKTEDLDLEGLVRLFDKTLNKHSFESLRSLFYNPPYNIDEISARQRDLRILMSKRDVLQSYTYTPIDFNEVYQFLNHEVELRETGLDRLFFLNTRNPALPEGKIIQAALFLNRISRFLREIEDRAFSSFFKEKIAYLQAFSSSLNTINLLESWSAKKLAASDIRRANNLLAGKKERKETTRFYEYFVQVESYISIAFSVPGLGFNFPELAEDELRLSGCYFPLLEDPVKNDFVKRNNIVLLTGANMSGKSTFLKSVSACVYFGNLGLPVPASEAVVPMIDDFLLSINHKDNLKKGYSHFMAELMDLKEIIIKAGSGRRCFAVFDEIFSGTNNSDAVEILSATVNGLGAFDKSFFIISTHLNEAELQIAGAEIDAYHLECRLTDKNPVYSYRIREGWSDIKVGCILYESVGISALLQPRSFPPGLPRQ